MQVVLNTETLAFIEYVKSMLASPACSYVRWWQELLERLTDDDTYSCLMNPRQIYNWLMEQSREASECQSNVLHTCVRQAMDRLKDVSDPRTFLDVDSLLDKLLNTVDITPGASLSEEECSIIVDLKYIRLLENQPSF